MDVIDRVKLLKTLENQSYVELCKRSGIDSRRMGNLMARKAKIRHEDLVQLAKVFPEYEVWLFTGKEVPGAGQISPMTKQSDKAAEY